MALNLREMWSNGIKISFFSKKLRKIAQRLGASPHRPPSVIRLNYSILLYQRWSPLGRPWPRGHILKSLASKPQVLENCPCPRLEDNTLFWTVEISLENARNLAKNLRTPFFLNWSIGVGKEREAAPPPNCNFTNDKNVTKKPIVSSVSVSS